MANIITFFLFTALLQFLHCSSFDSLSYSHQAIAARVYVEVAEGLPSLLHQLGHLPLLVRDVDGVGHHQGEGDDSDYIHRDVDEDTVSFDILNQLEFCLLVTGTDNLTNLLTLL